MLGVYSYLLTVINYPTATIDASAAKLVSGFAQICTIQYSTCMWINY